MPTQQQNTTNTEKANKNIKSTLNTISQTFQKS